MRRARWLVAVAVLAGTGRIAADLRGTARSAGADPPDGVLVRILYTGNTNGYLRDCGCSRGPAYGLAQRAMVLQQARLPGRTLLFDVGNLSGDPTKVGAVVESMQSMGYALAAVGPVDEQVGAPYWEAVEKAGLPVVDGRGGRSSAQALWVGEVNGLRVGITSLSSLTQTGEVAAWLGRLADWRRANRLDLLLVSTPASPQQALVLAQADSEGSVDVVISPQAQPMTAQTVGRTWVLPTLAGGIGAGCLDVTTDPQRFRFRILRPTLDTPEDPVVLAIVNRYYEDQQQELAAASGDSAPVPNPNSPLVLGFTPAQRCGDCHAQAYAQWRSSRHARAFVTLRDRSRLVPECLRCHSEVFRNGGKLAADEEILHNGVECATCHGDGILHSVVETQHGLREKVDKQVCVSCHTADTDPKFDFSQAWARIAHGLDRHEESPRHDETPPHAR